MRSSWDGTQTAPTLTANNANGAQRMPDKDNFNAVICIGNGQLHDAMSPSNEVSKTLHCLVDPMKVLTEEVDMKTVVRRLTPLECTRLQGYP